MLTKQLIKIGGNSRGIILDKALLGLVDAEVDSVFKVTVEGKRLVFEVLSKEEVNAMVMKAADEVIEEHAPLFEKLAK